MSRLGLRCRLGFHSWERRATPLQWSDWFSYRRCWRCGEWQARTIDVHWQPIHLTPTQLMAETQLDLVELSGVNDVLK